MTPKKTHEEFLQQVYNLVGNDFTILGQYKHSHQKIEVQCKKCNYIYLTQPSAFLTGKGCPKCAINGRANKFKKTTEQFVEEISNLVGQEYEVLSEYVNNNTKVKMKHNICNNIIEIVPNNFLRGSRCSKCRGKKIG